MVDRIKALPYNFRQWMYRPGMRHAKRSMSSVPRCGGSVKRPAMDYEELLVQTQTYVRDFFAAHADPRYVYHNLRHTEKVVQAAEQIANHFQLSPEDFFIVVAAAWFHDLGYLLREGDHEEEGARLAQAFLEKIPLEERVVRAVRGCILATRIPQKPGNLLEQILCDADLFHLGTEEFREVNKRMRAEAELVKGVAIDKQTWRKHTIQFLGDHHYHTDYVRLLLGEGKARNMERLQEKAARDSESPATAPAAGEKKKKEKAGNRPERGIETMFRVTSTNNQRLSDMADNKAHIMITVNSIILSAVISLLLRKLDSNPHLIIPTYLILAVGVFAIIFSILATRPNLPSGTFTQDDIDKKQVNLLFFGNFYRMNLDDYTQGMLRVMEDRDFLYGSLIRDVYSQGIVLGRKYRLLRISYNIFMYGLIASVIAFVIATVY